MPKWIKNLGAPTAANVNLICFHHSGGSVNSYRGWRADLPQQIALYGVQLPGREERFTEPLIDNFETLVAALLPELGAVCARPFAFFGHSLGAGLAFELTRELRRRGLTLPIHLFVSGRECPQHPDPPIWDLSESAFIDQLKAFGGMPAEVLENEELLELVLPILRADCKLNDHVPYHAEPPLAVPITGVFGDDEGLSVEQQHGWAEHTSKGFDKHQFPGGHFFIKEHQSEILSVVASALGAERHRPNGVELNVETPAPTTPGPCPTRP
jgi:surfactin synthase thioesterase subunit